MVVGVVLTIWFAAAAISLLRPRFGAALLWFFILLYPNTAMYGLLPLNVRLDNLWAVLIFIIALASPQSRKETPALFWLAVLWLASVTLGSVAGLVTTGGANWEDVVKFTARGLYVPMTTYFVYNLINSREDLDRYLKLMTLAAVCGGLLAIAMVYFPRQLNIFLLPRYFEQHGMTALEMLEAGEALNRRAQGTVGIISLAVMMMTMTPLALCMVVYQRHPTWRLYYGAAAAVCGAALIYTITRGAIGGFMAGVLFAMAFTRKRGTLLMIAAIGIGLALAEGSLLEKLMTRLGYSAVGGAGHLQVSWEGRLSIVEHFIENFSVAYLLFGVGFISAMVKEGATIHNTYLGALVYCGILGAVVMILIVRQTIVLGVRALRIKDDWLPPALGTFLLMTLIGYLVYGIVAELFQTTLSMHLLFTGMVFVQRSIELHQEARAPAGARVPMRLPESPVILPGPYVAGRGSR